MSKKELKPCPFCGGEVDYVHTDHRDLTNRSHHYICRKCNATVFIDSAGKYKSTEATEQEAITAFNTRAITPDIADKISQELQNAGFEDASKWLDCKYEL